MKKIFIIMILILSSLCCLAGCSNNISSTETINENTVLACMKQDSIKKSEKGSNLTYYYISPSDISIYYVSDWKKGVVSLKKYFWDSEQYNLQKKLYSNAKENDKNLTISVKEYTVIEDMDTYWTEIENSSTYTIVQ